MVLFPHLSTYHEEVNGTKQWVCLPSYPAKMQGLAEPLVSFKT